MSSARLSAFLPGRDVSYAGQREVDFLILGAGWTSQFLIPLLESHKISFAATTTTGRDKTIKFVFDPNSDEREPYTALPRASTILITFPLKGKEQPGKLLDLYKKTHAAMTSNWIQLGSTGIYTGEGWANHESDYDTTNERAVAEDALLELDGCVLNLAGLYGGQRDPRHWLPRVAKSKEQMKGKTSLHMIHGEDVARGIVQVHKKFSNDRWLLTDMHVYDWWDLAFEWGGDITEKWKGENEEDRPQYRKWILELMLEEGVRALPRNTDSLQRCLDSRDFWKSMGIQPVRGRIQMFREKFV